MNERLVQYVVTQHCGSMTTTTTTLQEKEEEYSRNGLSSTASSSNKSVLYYSKFNIALHDNRTHNCRDTEVAPGSSTVGR